MDAWLQRLWYGNSVWRWGLAPLAILFWLVTSLRRLCYRVRILRSIRVRRPVIVVGNIVAGGVGKTPFVIWLASQLMERGLKPAIVSRGYGGSARDWPQNVSAETDPALVGDEPVLIAQRTGCMVVADPDRVAAVNRAIDLGADVLISDDGLQHYRLQRDFEIAVVDGTRGFGNGWLLPAGPLRESRGRLKRVDAVVMTEREGSSVVRHELAKWRPVHARNTLGDARSMQTSEARPLASFRGVRVHAVAAVGNPESFFAGLRNHGIDVAAHPFPDHANLATEDLDFNDDWPVLMTEKDAVKCRRFAHDRCWVVPLEVEVIDSAKLFAKLDAVLTKSHRSQP